MRQIRPEDKQALLEGLARMSERSRYSRFLGAKNTLSEKELTYLTEVDQKDHLAWGAAERGSGLGLGVARCIRVPEEPNVAEVAVAVVDSHQGRGLGTILLGVLGAAALKQGIDTFRGQVLGDNQAMLQILEEKGGVARYEAGVGSIDVPVVAGHQPQSPIGKVFREITRLFNRLVEAVESLSSDSEDREDEGEAAAGNQAPAPAGAEPPPAD